MLSATFIDNRWHGCWGPIALLKDHPIKDNKTFKDVLGTRNAKGKWVDPSRTKIYRLQISLQGFVVAVPGPFWSFQVVSNILFALNSASQSLPWAPSTWTRSDDDDYGSDDNRARLKAARRAMQACSHYLLEKQAVEIKETHDLVAEAKGRERFLRAYKHLRAFFAWGSKQLNGRPGVWHQEDMLPNMVHGIMADIGVVLTDYSEPTSPVPTPPPHSLEEFVDFNNRYINMAAIKNAHGPPGNRRLIGRYVSRRHLCGK
ncbi:MAG: hypothetical protein Q9161_001702 [Pseudevernia consocians]